MTNQFLRGSEWRKCDLHIHTPFSIEHQYGGSSVDDVWDKFISDLEKESNYPKGSIIGISDYYFLDGYDKVLEYKKAGRLANIEKIFPVIELRVKEFGGSRNKLSRVNYHVLFNPDKYTSQTIKEQFISTMTSCYKLSPQYEDKQSIWQASLTKESLKDLGKKIKATVPEAELQNYGTDFEEGFNNFNISMENLENIVSRDIFNNNILHFVGKTEWNEIQWNDQSIAEKKNIINGAHFIFSAYGDISNYEKDFKYLSDSKVNNRLLDCSDAHCFSDSENKDRLGNCSLWIKGKPCFETIRQAYFSYDTRIKMSKEKPTQAINYIEKIGINLPADYKIADNDCCFSGENIEISLSPALNCFIGGRGTGKSLLLQLCCKNNEESLPKGDKNIVDKIMPGNWRESVKIDDIEFEYFGQGTVEKFYENRKSFKKSISDRLYKFWETEEYRDEANPDNSIIFISEINEKKKILSDQAVVIEEQILLLERKVSNDNKIGVLNKEIATRKKIVETLQDEAYKKLQRDIAEISKKISFIDESQKALSQFKENISKVLKDTDIIPLDGNEDIQYYAKKHNELFSSISALISIVPSEEQVSWIEKEKRLRASLESAENDLKGYLNVRGMSKINIQDAMKAQKELNDFNSQISKLSVENSKKEMEISAIRESIIAANTCYCQTIDKILRKTEDILKEKGNDEISKLTFKYEYDKALMFNSICSFLKDKTGIDKTDFEAILKRRNSDQKKEDITSNMLEILCENNLDLKSSGKILSFFKANSRNKNIYDLIYLSRKYNYAEYETFLILYENKGLDDLSFGQRATAIILTLLLFANKPLIIDEPEAHLDQRFIASKLVNVIKQVKSDKQIIFATHNANIVINADAEQIYILKTETAGNNKTSFTPMSIEDVYEGDKKEELMLLEGSLEAFKLREHKYSL